MLGKLFCSSTLSGKYESSLQIHQTEVLELQRGKDLNAIVARTVQLTAVQCNVLHLTSLQAI